MCWPVTELREVTVLLIYLFGVAGDEANQKKKLSGLKAGFKQMVYTHIKRKMLISLTIREVQVELP